MSTIKAIRKTNKSNIKQYKEQYKNNIKRLLLYLFIQARHMQDYWTVNMLVIALVEQNC